MQVTRITLPTIFTLCSFILQVDLKETLKSILSQVKEPEGFVPADVNFTPDVTSLKSSFGKIVINLFFKVRRRKRGKYRSGYVLLVYHRDTIQHLHVPGLEFQWKLQLHLAQTIPGQLYLGKGSETMHNAVMLDLTATVLELFRTAFSIELHFLNC